MRRSTSRRPSYADIASTLALVLILGSGTAYASHLMVNSSDIVNESITSADVLGRPATSSSPAVNGTLTTHDIRNGTVAQIDLANGAVTTPKISPNAITGPLVAADALTGADVDEATLGTVPFATQAGTVVPGAIGTESLAFRAVTPDRLATVDRWRYIGDPGEPAFENGWRNYDTTASHSSAQWQHVAYGRDAYGTIHLRGLAAGGPIGAPMFRLSNHDCPWHYHALPAISNNALARITVQWVTPTCAVYPETGSNAWISLDGLAWQDYALERRTAPASAAAGSSSTGTSSGGPTSLPVPPRSTGVQEP